MKTITLANQKGGCGKTTTAQTLAIGLVNKGYKVLAIDCDPQCNLSSVFGISPEDNGATLFEVMKGEKSLKECVVNIRIGLDILPGSLFLNEADRTFTKPATAPFILQRIVSKVSEYDFCILDTAPSLGIMTINALIATDYLIIPMTPDYFTIQGLCQLKNNIEDVKEINENLKVSGLLLTRCDRTSLTGMLKEDIATAAETMGTKVFETTIRQGVAIRESQLLQSNIFEESPKAAVTEEYSSFIDEFLRKEGL